MVVTISRGEKLMNVADYLVSFLYAIGVRHVLAIGQLWKAFHNCPIATQTPKLSASPKTWIQMSEPTQVFISYARTDGLDVAGVVQAELENSGFKVWRDL